MRFNFSISLCLVLLLTTHASGQVILNLSAGEGGGPVRLSWPLDPLSNREGFHVDSIPRTGKTGIKLGINSCNSLHIKFGNEEQTILVRPGTDTIKLNFDQLLKNWRSTDYPTNFYSNSIAIDSSADRMMISMGRPGASSALKKAKLLADSLRKRYSGLEEDACICEYAHFTASFLELSAGRPANQAFFEQTFTGRSDAYMNPAFSAVFHQLFDGLFYRSGKNHLADNWKDAYNPAEPYQHFREWLKINASIQNDTLLQWVLLNLVQELNFSGAVQKEALLILLKDSKPNFHLPAMKDLAEYLEFRIQFSIRGNTFPDFSFRDASSDKIYSLSQLKNKPIYLIYLPQGDDEYLQNLLYLNGFQKKYGKEFNFLALVNGTSAKSLASLAHKQGFTFYLAAFEDCTNFRSETLESLANPGFILIDRKGLIWQSPAESPETGVEAAFLGLIKQ